MRAIAIGIVVLGLLLGLGGCNDGEPAPLGLTGFVRITGTAEFDRVPLAVTSGTPTLDHAATTRQPIAGCVVEVEVPGTGIISSSVTDSAGRFTVQAPALTEDVVVRIVAGLGQREAIHTWVEDENERIYAISQTLGVGNQDLSISLVADSGWNAGAGLYVHRRAAPFAILDTVRHCRNRVASILGEAAPELPNLPIRWSGDRSSTFYGSGTLFLAGNSTVDTDEFDEPVIAHEWIHYYLDRVSIDDSRGGDHSLRFVLDETVAFSEGIADALAGVLLEDPLYADTITGAGFSFNLEIDAVPGDQFAPNPLPQPNGGAVPFDGPHSEASVYQVIWDIYDDTPANGESVALGARPLFAALEAADYIQNPYFTSIFNYLAQLQADAPGDASGIAALAETEKIRVGNRFQATTITYGPRYRLVPIDDNEGDPEEINDDASGRPLTTYDLFSNAGFNWPALPANFLWQQQRFHTEPVQLSGIYRITVDPITPGGNPIILFPSVFDDLTAASFDNGADLTDVLDIDMTAGQALIFSVTSADAPCEFTVRIQRIAGAG